MGVVKRRIMRISCDNHPCRESTAFEYNYEAQEANLIEIAKIEYKWLFTDGKVYCRFCREK